MTFCRHHRVLVAIAVLLQPTAAQAHLVTTGFGPFYDGVSHFLLTPEDALPALALALFAGLRGASSTRLALFALPGAWLVCGVLGLACPTATPGTLLTTVSFLVLGGLVAADARLRAGAVVVIALVVGALHGFLNGSAMAQAKLGFQGLAGIVSMLFAGVALVSALVVALRAAWTRIAVRVAGSWIAAAGLLQLGWSLRSP